MHDQKKHIEKIRLDFKNGSDRLKESSLNAIKKLADDLYTKSTHFILELIQNAEDNKYGDNIKPALSFYLTHSDPTNTSNSSGALIIQNNEIGFLPENIDAICAVGKTTKIKEQGYIGEKGIGFKSVFKISSNPYIISKDYCFYLPEKDVETKLGYIVPCWWENPSESLLMDSGTTIILPLDKSDYPYQKLETMLCDIDPVTILFISKIRKIDIKTDSGADFSIQKDDSKFPQVQMKILDRKKSEKVSVVYEFIVSKKNFDRPNEINQELKRGNS
jgi:hypothetical protein